MLYSKTDSPGFDPKEKRKEKLLSTAQRQPFDIIPPTPSETQRRHYLRGWGGEAAAAQGPEGTAANSAVAEPGCAAPLILRQHDA